MGESCWLGDWLEGWLGGLCQLGGWLGGDRQRAVGLKDVAQEAKVDWLLTPADVYDGVVFFMKINIESIETL